MLSIFHKLNNLSMDYFAEMSIEHESILLIRRFGRDVGTLLSGTNSTFHHAWYKEFRPDER